MDDHQEVGAAIDDAAGVFLRHDEEVGFPRGSSPFLCEVPVFFVVAIIIVNLVLPRTRGSASWVIWPTVVVCKGHRAGVLIVVYLKVNEDVRI